MDFFFVIVFLILYYVRPHEWMALMSSAQPITKVMALALASGLFYTGRRVNWRPLHFVSELLRTPQDWAMLAFLWWILHASVDAGAVWAMLYSLFAYYVVVEHALSTPKRIEIFMWFWLGLILFISTMAVLSEYEIDPFGTYGWTHGMYKGRLVLNLSIFRNPNALAHSVILVFPMIYFLGIWHRFLLVRELALPLFIMPGWCLYWTQSKGAFLSGGAGIVTSLTVGRPKWFQLSVIIVGYAVGLSALMLLPRMHELESIRGDAGFRGRLLAWNFAWKSFEELPNGLGYKQFTRFVPVYTEGDISVRKPTHSSYVEVGAELGKNGLFLWLAILYYCLKSLALAKTRDDQEERLRRLLFSLVIIYMASSWMTNISYRGTFFIQTGVVAALVRCMRQRRDESEGGEGVEGEGEGPEGDPEALAEEKGEADVEVLPPAESPALPVPVVEEGPGESSDASDAEDEHGVLVDLWAWVRGPFTRRRLLVFALDMALVYVIYRVVIRAWLYFMLDWTGF